VQSLFVIWKTKRWGSWQTLPQILSWICSLLNLARSGPEWSKSIVNQFRLAEINESTSSSFLLPCWCFCWSLDHRPSTIRWIGMFRGCPAVVIRSAIPSVQRVVAALYEVLHLEEGQESERSQNEGFPAESVDRQRLSPRDALIEMYPYYAWTLQTHFAYPKSGIEMDCSKRRWLYPPFPSVLYPRRAPHLQRLDVRTETETRLTWRLGTIWGARTRELVRNSRERKPRRVLDSSFPSQTATWVLSSVGLAKAVGNVIQPRWFSLSTERFYSLPTTTKANLDFDGNGGYNQCRLEQSISIPDFGYAKWIWRVQA